MIFVAGEKVVRLLHELGKSGTIIFRRERKIGSAQIRFLIGSKKHTERPATLTGQGHQGFHVYSVHIRPLLTVHLDVDELLIHDFCGFRIFKGFMRHDMAPVASGVSNAEKNGFVFRLGLF